MNCYKINIFLRSQSILQIHKKDSSLMMREKIYAEKVRH